MPTWRQREVKWHCVGYGQYRPVIGSRLRGLDNYHRTKILLLGFETPPPTPTLLAIYINLSKDLLFPPSPGARFGSCGFEMIWAGLADLPALKTAESSGWGNCRMQGTCNFPMRVEQSAEKPWQLWPLAEFMMFIRCSCFFDALYHSRLLLPQKCCKLSNIKQSCFQCPSSRQLDTTQGRLIWLVTSLPQILGCHIIVLLERKALWHGSNTRLRGKKPSWCYNDSSLDSSRKTHVLVPYSFVGINYCVNPFWILVPCNISYHLDFHFEHTSIHALFCDKRRLAKQEPGWKYSSYKKWKELRAAQSELLNTPTVFARSWCWPRMATSLS